tara:strand:+ start:35 stop:415 length:381 start_codon:yes stop_codon:yes gene_type:complete
MEPIALDSRMLLQLAAVLASLSGAWMLVRTQVRNLIASREEMKKSIAEIYGILDKVQAGEAVKGNQLKTISKILSPDNLERRNRELGGVLSEIGDLKLRMKAVEQMHNGTHPFTIGEKDNGKKEER